MNESGVSRAYKIRFYHYRRDSDGNTRLYSRKTKGFVPATKGGMTYCVISCDGKVYLGIARCSNKDNFSYRLGRHIAMGRAIKRFVANDPSSEEEIMEVFRTV